MVLRACGFGGLPVYGWEFIDPPESDRAHWRDRLSVDARFEARDARHVFDLFQEGHARHLDVRVWFDSLAVQDSSGRPVPIGDYIADGVRWWDAMYAGDPRTDTPPAPPGH